MGLVLWARSGREREHVVTRMLRLLSEFAASGGESSPCRVALPKENPEALPEPRGFQYNFRFAKADVV